jgi:hypothetical protein
MVKKWIGRRGCLGYESWKGGEISFFFYKNLLPARDGMT